MTRNSKNFICLYQYRKMTNDTVHNVLFHLFIYPVISLHLFLAKNSNKMVDDIKYVMFIVQKIL